MVESSLHPRVPAIAAALLCLVAADASAAHFTVDDAGDGVDARPGDVACATVEGRCTLRAAVMEANARPGADTIEVPWRPGAAVALRLGNDASCAEGPDRPHLDACGDLDIFGRLVIAGRRDAATPAGRIPRLDGRGLVDPAGRRPESRLFDLAPGARLQLRDLTLSGAETAGDGGALRARDASLLLDRVRIEATTAGGRGGGAALFHTWAWIEGSRIDDCRADGGGAGLYAELRPTSPLTARGLVVEGNRTGAWAAGDAGGALWLRGRRGAEAALRSPQFLGNRSAGGRGALTVDGPVDVSLELALFLRNEVLGPAPAPGLSPAPAGGALSVDPRARVSLRWALFERNVDRGSGFFSDCAGPVSSRGFVRTVALPCALPPHPTDRVEPAATVDAASLPSPFTRPSAPSTRRAPERGPGGAPP